MSIQQSPSCFSMTPPNLPVANGPACVITEASDNVTAAMQRCCGSKAIVKTYNFTSVDDKPFCGTYCEVPESSNTTYLMENDIMGCFPGAEAMNVSAYGSKCFNFHGPYSNSGTKSVGRFGGVTVLLVMVASLIGGLVV